MTKKIYMTDKMLEQLKVEWFERGKKFGKEEMAQQIAEVMGLFDLFERKQKE